MNEARNGQVVTFYSYKGGVGRTLALVDVAVMLARLGRRVLAVDWDLEAPGLDAYFSPYVEGPAQRGLLELISEFEETKPDDVLAAARQVTIPETKGSLDFLSAGGEPNTRLELVQSLDWDKLYARDFGRWLENVRSAWQMNYDFILIDSRTGISDVGGICTVQLPEILVTLFTPNRQSMDGTISVAHRATEALPQLPLDRAPLRILPIPTRIDKSEHQLSREWEKEMFDRFSPFVEAWSDAPKRTDHLFKELIVPYIPYWSFGEQIPAIVGDKFDRLTVEYAHETLSLLLAANLTDVGRVIDERGDARESLSEEHPFDIFISNMFLQFSVEAFNLAKALRKRGASVALPFDSSTVPLGEWVEEHEEDYWQRIRTSPLLVVTCTESDNKRGQYSSRLMGEAKRRREGVIPICDSDLSVPRYLNGFAGLQADLRDPVQIARVADQLMEVRERLRGRPEERLRETKAE